MKARTLDPDPGPLTWFGALRRVLGRLGRYTHPAVAQPLQTAPVADAPNSPTTGTMQALAPPPMERPSLQDALAQRAAFWSAATHDLCQPAQALALFVDRLQGLPADPKAQQVHAYLDSSMQDLTRLLNGLLEVARLDAGQVLPAFAPVSVEALLARVAQEIAPQAEQKGLRLRVRSAGQWVLADGAILEHIVLALAHNAVRFTDDGTVFLSARSCAQGRSLRIDISDSGVGIAQRDHAKVFEPFAQRNLARQSQALRPSLGLYIARRHAALLGSSIQLRSALGRGSRFSLVVPQVLGMESAQADGGGAESTRLRGLQLVLLDTQDARRAAMQSLLASWGCSVHGGEWGAQPDGIVLAWDEAQGLASLQSLPAWGAVRVPVCVVYAEALAQTAQSSGQQAVVYLADPLQPAQLRAWLRRLPRSQAGV